MNKTVKAFVSWIPTVKGGRRQPPTGPVYTAPCRFVEDRGWPEETWSLVVRLLDSVDDGRFWYAEVGFLVDQAPAQLLHPDARFELHEGRKMVALGLVVDADTEPPTRAEDFKAVLLS